MALREFTSGEGIKLMAHWNKEENEIITLNAGALSSKQISNLLVGRTAKAVRHQAEKLGIKLTGYIKHSKDEIKLALELRTTGFTRAIIEIETGLSKHAQYYYEGRRNA